MKKLIILHTVLALFLTTCKKGEDDPSFSLLSRKARVEGDWKLEKASVTVGLKDSIGAYSAFIYDLDADKYTMVNTGKGSRFDGPSTLNISFTKKGEFTVKQVIDSVSLDSDGTWDFQGRVGENKNKEKIIVHLNSMRGNSNLFRLFNKSNINFTYRIKELRSKKMVLECDEEMILLDKSAGIYVTSEYTFIQ